MRRQNMPELVADVERVIRTGDLDHVVRFSKNQIVDELRKGAFLEQHPELSGGPLPPRRPRHAPRDTVVLRARLGNVQPTERLPSSVSSPTLTTGSN